MHACPTVWKARAARRISNRPTAVGVSQVRTLAWFYVGFAPWGARWRDDFLRRAGIAIGYLSRNTGVAGRKRRYYPSILCTGRNVAAVVGTGGVFPLRRCLFCYAARRDPLGTSVAASIIRAARALMYSFAMPMTVVTGCRALTVQ